MPAILGPLTHKRNFGIDLLARVIFFGCFLAALLFGPMIAGADDSADELWKSSPVIVCHTHLDPDNIRSSIDELINAEVTTAVVNLTIDDGDWRGSAQRFVTYGQSDDSWGARFQERLAALERLEKNGVIVIVKQLSDIPRAPDQVKRFRDSRKIAVIIASEGSNQIEGPRQVAPDNPASRDSAPKTITLQSIAGYKARGWLSTALAHQFAPSAEAGHRLLRADNRPGLNDYGRFTALTLFSEGILVDLPHTPEDIANEVLEIAAIKAKPVMVSHDNPLTLYNNGQERTLIRIASSGGGTGLVGVHSYKGYLNPPTIGHYEKVIDEGCKRFEKIGIKPGDRHLALGLDWFFHADMNVNDWAGRGPGDLKQLVPLLRRDGYTDQQIKNILGENMLRLIECAWKK